MLEEIQHLINREVRRALLAVKTSLVKEMASLITANHIEPNTQIIMGLDHAIKKLDEQIQKLVDHDESI